MNASSRCGPAIAASLLLLALAGCSSPSEDGPVQATPIEGCEVPQAGSAALRTAAAVVTFFEDHCRGDAPQMDLDRQVVVWHAMGPRATGGHHVELSLAERQGDAMQVTFLEVSPGPTCNVTQAETHPTGVWLLDATADAIRLMHNTTTRDCGG